MSYDKVTIRGLSGETKVYDLPYDKIDQIIVEPNSTVFIKKNIRVDGNLLIDDSGKLIVEGNFISVFNTKIFGHLIVHGNLTLTHNYLLHSNSLVTVNGKVHLIHNGIIDGTLRAENGVESVHGFSLNGDIYTKSLQITHKTRFENNGQVHIIDDRDNVNEIKNTNQIEYLSKSIQEIFNNELKKI